MDIDAAMVQQILRNFFSQNQDFGNWASETGEENKFPGIDRVFHWAEFDEIIEEMKEKENVIAYFTAHSTHLELLDELEFYAMKGKLGDIVKEQSQSVYMDCRDLAMHFVAKGLDCGFAFPCPREISFSSTWPSVQHLVRCVKAGEFKNKDIEEFESGRFEEYLDELMDLCLWRGFLLAMSREMRAFGKEFNE
jgi:hypothetical protein